MIHIIIKRTLSAIPVLILVSVFAFALLKAIPGDPVSVLLGGSEKEIGAGQLKLLREEMGLTQPWPKQYFNWMSGWWGQGELGRSYRDGRPVSVVIGERAGATFLLAGMAIALSFALGIAGGLFMALISWHPLGRLASRLLVSLTLFFYSAPSFWLALLALFAFQRYFPGWPLIGLHAAGQHFSLDTIKHALLPALLLSSRKAAKIALFVKAMVSNQMSSDYVLTARSKGLGWSVVVFKHVFKNSLPPVISLLGLSLPAVFGGSILIETIFGWPGLGRLVVDATFGRNYPIMLATVVMYGGFVVASNLLADVLCCLSDPRLREESVAAAMPEAA